MKLTEKNLIGQIADYPLRLAQLAYDRTVEAVERNTSSFKGYGDALSLLQSKGIHGSFIFSKTPEGIDFWTTIFRSNDYSAFEDEDLSISSTEVLIQRLQNCFEEYD